MSHQKNLEFELEKLQLELEQANQKLQQEIEKSQQLEKKCRFLERKAFQKQQILRQIIDTTPNLIFINDANGKFVLVNQAVAELYKTSVENLIGKTDADFEISKSKVEKIPSPNCEINQKPKSVSITEQAFALPTGEKYYFQTIQTPILMNDDKQQYSLNICIDITANRELQNQIDRYKARESKLRDMISNFITTTSHEFRTPLTTILSSTELLLFYSNNWSEYKIFIHLDRIKNAVQHLIQMLDSLLFIEA